MGGGKERKMNGGSATADHVKDRLKRLKQKLFKTESDVWLPVPMILGYL
jgi:hypothetical protein